MSDLRIQPLPPETLAAQRPVVEPARPAIAPAPAAPQGGAGSSTSAGNEGARDQYISPFISIDPTSGLVITQYRNSVTGELQQQYPSAKVVREYRNLQPAAVSPSGGPSTVAAAGQPADAGGQGRTVAAGQAATGAGRAPAAPTPTPTPAPVAAPAPGTPTGGVDKGSA